MEKEDLMEILRKITREKEDLKDKLESEIHLVKNEVEFTRRIIMVQIIVIFIWLLAILMKVG